MYTVNSQSNHSDWGGREEGRERGQASMGGTGGQEFLSSPPTHTIMLRHAGRSFLLEGLGDFYKKGTWELTSLIWLSGRILYVEQGHS